MKKYKLFNQSKKGYDEFSVFQEKYFILQNMKHYITYEKY